MLKESRRKVTVRVAKCDAFCISARISRERFLEVRNGEKRPSALLLEVARRAYFAVTATAESNLATAEDILAALRDQAPVPLEVAAPRCELAFHHWDIPSLIFDVGKITQEQLVGEVEYTRQYVSAAEIGRCKLTTNLYVQYLMHALSEVSYAAAVLAAIRSARQRFEEAADPRRTDASDAGAEAQSA